MSLKLVMDPVPPKLAPPSLRRFDAQFLAKAGVWVVNVRTPAPFDVYVGRAHPRFASRGWGNEYRVSRRMSREEAVARFWDDLEAFPERYARAQRELRGKILGCWCAPALCHAHVYAWIANGLEFDD